MIQRPDQDIAEYLESQGIGTFDKEGSDIFLGPMKPPKIINEIVLIPERSIWINVTGGPQPDRVFGHAVSFHRTAIQIMVRGMPNQFIDCRDLAKEIWDELEGATGITNYEVVLAQQDGPVFLDYDENNRPIFSLNFLEMYNV